MEFLMFLFLVFAYHFAPAAPMPSYRRPLPVRLPDTASGLLG